MSIPIVLLSTVLALVEIAALMLLARGVLWLLGPKARKGNFVYDIATAIVTPFMRVTRRITPRVVGDARVPIVTFLLLVGIWVALTLTKQTLCTSYAMRCVS